MARGKYSPTVNFSYQKDQSWFHLNGGDFDNGINPHSYYDDDGFDSYGYNAEGFDRAGYTENDYLCDSDLYEEVAESNQWCCNLAVRRQVMHKLASDISFTGMISKREELEQLIRDAQKLLVSVNQSIDAAFMEEVRKLD